MKYSVLCFTILIFVFSTCEKANDEQFNDRIIGRHFDPELIGKWTKSSLSRDINNGITSWIDSIRFDENNTGNQKIYRFSVLEQNKSFLYYTDQDSLFMIQGKKIDKWIYTIRNDSLFIATSLPLYSSYHSFGIYKKSE